MDDKKRCACGFNGDKCWSLLQRDIQMNSDKQAKGKFGPQSIVWSKKGGAVRHM